MNKKYNKFQIGSIISGTLKNEDLIPAFISELSYLDTNNSLISKIEDKMETEDYFESEDSYHDIESLIDALNDFIDIPYVYFGCSIGDSSNFGFFIDHESIEYDIYDHEILKCEDTSEIPDSYNGYVLLINDHGNMILYNKSKDNYFELWSIV